MDLSLERSLIAGAVAVGLWLLTRWFELVSVWVRHRRERRNMVCALYAEIDFNRFDLRRFSSLSASLDQIREHLFSDPDALPHVTDAHHTIVYTTHIDRLHHLSQPLTAHVVEFYGLLDKIKTQIDGINLPSYSKVSPKGKVDVIERLLTRCNECAALGDRIQGEFQREYAGYDLPTPR